MAPLLGEALLPELLSLYLDRYPKVRVEISLSPEYVDLRRANVDVALRSGEIDDAEDLYAVRLGTSVTGCYAHPGYLEARGVPRRLADLAAHDCIVVGGDASPTWTFHERRRDVEVAVNARVRVNDYRMAGAIAAAGAGIVRLARFHAAARVEAGQLSPVLEARWPKVIVSAVHASVSPAPTKIRAFVELAREAAARVLDP
jgi:DNA-binding transcriptional LysR family regulator